MTFYLENRIRLSNSSDLQNIRFSDKIFRILLHVEVLGRCAVQFYWMKYLFQLGYSQRPNASRDFYIAKFRGICCSILIKKNLRDWLIAC